MWFLYKRYELRQAFEVGVRQLLLEASCLITWYQQTRDIQDLQAVIVGVEAAIKAMPESHTDRAGWLDSLGDYLGSRYERTGNLQDLEAAITHGSAVVEATPEDHPDRARWLSNLGSRLSSRYQRTGNLEDLEAAIKHTKAAVEAAPENHPQRAAWLISLAHNLHERAAHIHVSDLEAAIAAFFSSWSIRTAPVLVRLIAALRAVKILTFNPLVRDLSRACSLLHDATHLIPQATLRSLDHEDQQYILGKLAGLASLTVSVSLEAGRSPLEALQLQELGRSITNGQLLDYRADISDLMEQHPALAKEFDFL